MTFGSDPAWLWYSQTMTPLHVLRDTATGVLMFFFIAMLVTEGCMKAFQ